MEKVHFYNKIGRVMSRPFEPPPKIKLGFPFAKSLKKTDVFQYQNVNHNK